jgi:hypothetical protein
MGKTGKNQDDLVLATSENLDRLPSESASFDIDGIKVNVDEAKVEALKKQIEEKRKELSKKVYAVTMDSSTLSMFKHFINEEAEWNSTESLGIIEINKSIQKAEADGVKDNTIYFGSLTIEASHYFLSKGKGKGLESAKNFIKIFKPVDIALGNVKEDNLVINDLQKELNAAEQGLETC